MQEQLMEEQLMVYEVYIAVLVMLFARSAPTSR